jgi:hypothetical protein
MPSTLATLATRVLQRLEENPASPEFWTLQGEIYPYLVDVQNEAMLISGEPQLRQTTPTSLVVNQTLQTMPAGAVCILRVESAGALSIHKTTVYDLDRFTPGWENVTAPASINYPQFWFPVGLTQWGIYPKLTIPAQVIISYLSIPITTGRPYTGTEVCPFQTEYEEGFVQAAAHIARAKEGGKDFMESMTEYNDYLKKCQELSKFGTRKGSLRFSRSVGAPAEITPVRSRG